jgi:DNA mismatch endonuclease (patch repair protein)
MADVVSPEVRSRMMAGIRGKNTKPEIFLRSGLHRLGYRFRLHDAALPGKPDLVLPKWNAVIFVHGCFWHGHDCRLFRLPATRTEFWEKKIAANRSNDQKSLTALRRLGWRTLTVWECAIRGADKISAETIFDLIVSWLRSQETMAEVRGGGNERTGHTV